MSTLSNIKSERNDDTEKADLSTNEFDDWAKRRVKREVTYIPLGNQKPPLLAAQLSKHNAQLPENQG